MTLQEEFEKETGYEVINLKQNYGIYKYVKWLEQRNEKRFSVDSIVMWRSVEDELPTEVDADENGKVLVWREVNESQKSLEKSIYDWSMVKHLSKGSKWITLPKLPKAK